MTAGPAPGTGATGRQSGTVTPHLPTTCPRSNHAEPAVILLEGATSSADCWPSPAMDLPSISGDIRVVSPDLAQLLSVIRFQIGLLRYRRLGALSRHVNGCRERTQIIPFCLRSAEQPMTCTATAAAQAGWVADGIGVALANLPV
jgi:hypothetical protein